MRYLIILSLLFFSLATTAQITSKTFSSIATMTTVDGSTYFVTLDGTPKVWKKFTGSTLRAFVNPTVTSISNGSGLTGISSPYEGDLAINTAKDTLWIRDDSAWIVFKAGSSGSTPSLQNVLVAGNSANSSRITNLGTPIGTNDATTKGYVDTQVSNGVDAAGSYAASVAELQGDSALARSTRLLRDSLARSGWVSTTDVAAGAVTWTKLASAVKDSIRSGGGGGGGTTDLINIENLGAVGDGTTDNLAIIQNGLDTYGAVYIPPGNFKVSGTIIIPVGGKILGSGYNSIISATAGDTLVRMRINSTIESVRLDGTDASGQVGVYWKGLGVVGVAVTNCHITDMIQGIRIDSTGYGPQLSSKVRGNHIRSCVTGIYLGQRAEYIQLIDNICEQNTTGVYMRAGNCSLIGGSTGLNSVGLSIDGGANNAHTSITGLSSNHNTSKNLEIDSVSLGVLITGCSFFAAPQVTVNESNSVQFVNCNFECTTNHAVVNSEEILYTNNIWWNGTSVPTFFTGSKGAMIGNRLKGDQAIIDVKAPGSTSVFPLNIEMPSTGNRGIQVTRQGVSSSNGFMALFSQTSAPGSFAPFWYSRSSSTSFPHLAFIALEDGSSDSGTTPLVSFQSADGFSPVNRPLFSFDSQFNDIAMRVNVGKNVTIGHGTTRQDSARVSVRGLSNSATSYSFQALSLDNTPRFRVANNGVVSITSTLWRNLSQTVGEFIGIGSPEGIVTANPGSTFVNSDGTNPAFYVKRTGTGNTSWNEAFVGLRASATLDFPDTASGTSSSLTISITGAATTDAGVSMQRTNTSIAGTFYEVQITSSNTATVYFHNFSGSNQNPASGTFNISVIK